MRRLPYITRREFETFKETIEERLENMATQADVDAVVAQVAQVETDLTDSSAKIQAELDALKQANPALDLSALQAAVAPLDGHAKALGSLKPA